MAKDAGCRYITLTTRHHDGFLLYDTRGLNTYDVMHTPYGRDIVADFVTACYKQGDRSLPVPYGAGLAESDV